MTQHSSAASVTIGLLTWAAPKVTFEVTEQVLFTWNSRVSHNFDFGVCS